MTDLTAETSGESGPERAVDGPLSAEEASRALSDGPGSGTGCEPPRSDLPSPRRVRVEGDLFHGRVPEGAVYVGRAAPGLKASRYANPFRIGHRSLNPATGYEVIVTDRYVATMLYGLLLERCTEPGRGRQAWVDRAIDDLRGRDLACWCPPGPCHVDPLLAFVNRGAA